MKIMNVKRRNGNCREEKKWGRIKGDEMEGKEKRRKRKEDGKGNKKREGKERR